MPYDTKEVFKKWVPEWMIKIILFIFLMPSMVLFFLPVSNLQACAGYYGCEPDDVTFLVVLFYAGFVGFYSLERRFYAFVATKEYFLLFNILQILTCLILYLSGSIYIVMPVRFIQGMLFASSVNLSISMIFSRLSTERAREISYSVFFGMLICSTPFTYIVSADLIDAFTFDKVYEAALFSFIPGLLLIIIATKFVRISKRFPLYDLDWESFALYSAFLISFGYTMVYGQEHYWLEGADIQIALSIGTFALLVFSFRQFALKRPYINLRIFRFRNFKVGLFLLFSMYLCRFDMGITNSYFAKVLLLDPRHISYINVFNLSGLVIGVVVSCAMLLQKKNIRLIWGVGFAFLLVFHVAMYFLFNGSANEYYYFVPLVLQGLGVGTIMVPTIIYVISSVGIEMGSSAAAACLAFRFFGYTVSLAIINYFELFAKKNHYDVFMSHLNKSNSLIDNVLENNLNTLTAHGLNRSQATKGSIKMLYNAANQQSLIRYAMDYYEMMAWFCLFILLLIILTPYINRTIISLKSDTLSPA